METYDMTPYLVMVVNDVLDFFHGFDEGVDAAKARSLSTVLTMKTHLYTSHLKYFGAFKRFDIKRKMQVLCDGAVVLNGVDGSCWVDYSAPGNILFGYISAARGLDRKVCWAAGGLLESLDLGRVDPKYREFWYDDPGDKAAVDLGWDLWTAHPEGLILDVLHKALTADMLSRLQAPVQKPAIPAQAFAGEMDAYPFRDNAFLNFDGEDEEKKF